MNVAAPDTRMEMTLEDRLTIETGWAYMTGMQALVRLPIQQRVRDAAAGLNTGGFISGYRGSPMGRYDMELWQAEDVLKERNIHFQPGVNEDLAATATWGSQYVGTFPGATVEGVFSIWYGKGPGVDRSIDPLRHANLAGTSAKGGTLVLAGDDHGAKSSTVANFSDYNFVSTGIPLLAPSNAQEVLDFGLKGIAMSRYSGCLVGMKLVTDVIEGGRSVYVAPDWPKIAEPGDKADVNLKVYNPPLVAEQLLYEEKIDHALGFARANGLNEITVDGPGAKLGIVASGKAYQDVMQALAGLGLSEGQLGGLGIRVLKLGLIWPLDNVICEEFATGLSTIIVVEEKRPLIEDQLRGLLYGQQGASQIVGKTFTGAALAADRGATAFPIHGEISPGLVEQVIARVAGQVDPGCKLTPSGQSRLPLPNSPSPMRNPAFCSGCPHGRSTKVIEGSRALAGIGCHSMAMLMNPMQTNSMSHMGGEGVMWIGQKPFTNERHVFTNMGDGTYFHSGFLAIRAAVAAKVPITYKLLHNGFVSMTGGQPLEGELSIPQVIGQLRAEGVSAIALVSDEPDKWQGAGLDATLHDRTEMDEVQKRLRDHSGVSVIIYEQPCATERRRLRKRGKWVDPDRRVYINPEVCEGCGDCSTVSGCMAIEPLKTGLGRKRQINQSSCNKDFSCLEGFCPGLVTVSGVTPKKRKAAAADLFDVSHLPAPEIPALDGSFAVLVAGIGGTGVVTIGQTLAVAAHIDGQYSSNLDITGLAQKYGAVLSHVKIAAGPEALHATRIAAGEADTLIGADLVVTAGDATLAGLGTARASAGVVNTRLVPTSDFAKNPDWQLSDAEMMDRIRSVAGDRLLPLDASALATVALGDAIFANSMLLGAAWQRGEIPLSHAALMRAMELNGVAIDGNKRAFALGRLAAHDLAALDARVNPATPPVLRLPQSLDDMVADRVARLTDYSNADYAGQYRAAVERVRAAGDDTLTRAVAANLYKLMAHKDEWEVARLYSRPEFLAGLRETFDGEAKLSFHLGGWPFGRPDPKTGKVTKREVGEWMLRAFGLMARFRGLRGSLLDPFRNSEEAQLARSLLAQYEADIKMALDLAEKGDKTRARALAALPEKIRGYGHVRGENAAKVAAERQKLLADSEDAQAA